VRAQPQRLRLIDGARAVIRGEEVSHAAKRGWKNRGKVDKPPISFTNERFYAHYEKGPSGETEASVLIPSALNEIEDLGTGVTRRTRFTEASFKSKGGKVFNTNAYSKGGKMIVAISNWKKWDTSDLSEEEKLKWSDLVWKSWTIEAGAEAKRLKYVLRYQVVNRGTIAMIAKAHVENKVPASGRGEWSPNTKEFNGLLGTDNGRGVVWLLYDHLKTLGENKTILKIYTWLEASSTERKPGMLFVLGDKPIVVKNR